MKHKVKHSKRVIGAPNTNKDSPDSLQKRIAHRPQHLARIQALQNLGKLMNYYY